MCATLGTTACCSLKIGVAYNDRLAGFERNLQSRCRQPLATEHVTCQRQPLAKSNGVFFNATGVGARGQPERVCDARRQGRRLRHGGALHAGWEQPPRHEDVLEEEQLVQLAHQRAVSTTLQQQTQQQGFFK